MKHNNSIYTCLAHPTMYTQCSMCFTGVFAKTTEKFEGAIEICVNSVGICLEHDYVKTVEVNYVSTHIDA